MNSMHSLSVKKIMMQLFIMNISTLRLEAYMKSVLSPLLQYSIYKSIKRGKKGIRLKDMTFFSRLPTTYLMYTHATEHT